jgi:hypothetical protein
MPPETLYHFTCAHGKRDIGTFNALLVPHLHPWIGTKLVWLTSNPEPDRKATGLTMNHQRCDRMEYRYVIADSVVLARCRAWLDAPERVNLGPDRLADFEDDGHAVAGEWWIADTAIPARFDRSYHQLPAEVR